jgi:hypothetical protein
LQRIAKLAEEMPNAVLTTLSHHIDLEWLREAYRRTRKDGALGVDGQSAAEYAENLEGNLQALLDRAKSGTYRAPAVRRVQIPKGDGKQTRPIGIPTHITNCTGYQTAFGMGDDHPSVSSPERSALRDSEDPTSVGRGHADLAQRGSRAE